MGQSFFSSMCLAGIEDQQSYPDQYFTIKKEAQQIVPLTCDYLYKFEISDKYTSPYRFVLMSLQNRASLLLTVFAKCTSTVSAALLIA